MLNINSSYVFLGEYDQNSYSVESFEVECSYPHRDILPIIRENQCFRFFASSHLTMCY